MSSNPRLGVVCGFVMTRAGGRRITVGRAIDHDRINRNAFRIFCRTGLPDIARAVRHWPDPSEPQSALYVRLPSAYPLHL